jgi:lantibiotic biosynthesis protein
VTIATTTGRAGWEPTTLAKARSARSVALEVAARLQNGRFEDSNGYRDVSLGGGDAGLAVLFGYLDRCFPERDWDQVAHRAMVRIGANITRLSDQSMGLFGGLAGIAFAAWYLSRGGTRYGRALAAAEDVLIPRSTALAESFSGRTGMPVEEYDVVSGLSGIAAYLLSRIRENRALRAVKTIAAALVNVIERDGGRPAWFTPAEMISAKSMIGEYPDGNLNCGLAHGAPAMLAVLAMAYRENVVVSRQRAAMERLAYWLAAQRRTERWGDSWPAAVGVNASDPVARAPVGWCYGNPGVARALWLTGKALDDPAFCEMAVNALRSSYRRPASRHGAVPPTFCHGTAGLLQITMRFAQETGLPDFGDAANSLLERLLMRFSDEAPFGYRDHDPELGLVDRAGLLDGAAGVALVLLAAVSNQDPDWDRVFLLS